ncbi:MAG: hypothetical protein D6726_05620 [Nitrospirae bacterium]|nr:MAG: hypothetical protein D6726_05620 [Nitrospirota bacterium]
MPTGTVWCSRRKIAMGKNRNLPCFVPLQKGSQKRCIDCKWAAMLRPSGETPLPGHIWCKRFHRDQKKMQTRECFE